VLLVLGSPLRGKSLTPPIHALRVEMRLLEGEPDGDANVPGEIVRRVSFVTADALLEQWWFEGTPEGEQPDVIVLSRNGVNWNYNRRTNMLFTVGGGGPDLDYWTGHLTLRFWDPPADLAAEGIRELESRVTDGDEYHRYQLLAEAGAAGIANLYITTRRQVVEVNGQRIVRIRAEYEGEQSARENEMFLDPATGLALREIGTRWQYGQLKSRWEWTFMVDPEVSPGLFALQLPPDVRISSSTNSRATLDWPPYIQGGPAIRETQPEAVARIQAAGAALGALQSMTLTSRFEFESRHPTYPDQGTGRSTFLVQRPDRAWAKVAWESRQESYSGLFIARDNDYLLWSSARRGRPDGYRLVRDGAQVEGGGQQIGWPALDHWDSGRNMPSLYESRQELLPAKLFFYAPEDTINLAGAQVVGRETIDGATCTIVEIPQWGVTPGRPTRGMLRLWIADRDDLLQRMMLEETRGSADSAYRVTRTETYRYRDLNAEHPESLFALTPPQGAKPLPGD